MADPVTGEIKGSRRQIVGGKVSHAIRLAVSSTGTQMETCGNEYLDGSDGVNALKVVSEEIEPEILPGLFLHTIKHSSLNAYS